MRTLGQSILLAFAFSFALGGCSQGQIADKMPESIGLPANTPARPTTPYQYPAVHDVPAKRDAPTLTEDEQIKLERDLTAARDRQRGQNVAGDKKKPSDANPAEAGAR